MTDDNRTAVNEKKLFIDKSKLIVDELKVEDSNKQKSSESVDFAEFHRRKIKFSCRSSTSAIFCFKISGYRSKALLEFVLDFEGHLEELFRIPNEILQMERADNSMFRYGLDIDLEVKF